jgi:hypothetical protein
MKVQLRQRKRCIYENSTTCRFCKNKKCRCYRDRQATIVVPDYFSWLYRGASLGESGGRVTLSR